MSLRADIPDRYATANGYRIRYIEKGAGRPLICIHGLSLPISADQYLVAIDALSEHSHVYALDMPGWGLSDLPAEGYSFAMWAETLRDFCEQLGLEEVDVAGQSLGGWTAAVFAYLNPRLVRRVILIGAAGLNPAPAAVSGAVQLPERDALRTHLWREWTDYQPITDEQVEELYRRSRREGRVEAWQAIQAYVGNEDERDRYSLRRILPHLDKPVLLAWGDDNSGIRVRYGIEAFWLAPKARLFVSYGGDHSAMGFTPREFEAAVRSFLTTDELRFNK